jgi:predicted RNA binding protein YcfA (HicA-like mRNA interferase family)
MPVSGKDLVREFVEQGWKRKRQNGSHVVLGNGTRRVSIPCHNNEDLPKGLEMKLRKKLE